MDYTGIQVGRINEKQMHIKTGGVGRHMRLKGQIVAESHMVEPFTAAGVSSFVTHARDSSRRRPFWCDRSRPGYAWQAARNVSQQHQSAGNQQEENNRPPG